MRVEDLSDPDVLLAVADFEENEETEGTFLFDMTLMNLLGVHPEEQSAFHNFVQRLYLRGLIDRDPRNLRSEFWVLTHKGWLVVDVYRENEQKKQE